MRAAKFNQKISSRSEDKNKIQTEFSRSGRYRVLLKHNNLQKENRDKQYRQSIR